MNTPIVQVQSLRKVYQKKSIKEGVNFLAKLLPSSKVVEDLVAVDDVSFHIEAGEIFGLLGPNGAGKTTIIKMLCTLLESSTGTATLNGYDVVTQADQVRQSLGGRTEYLLEIDWARKPGIFCRTLSYSTKSSS